MKANVHKYEGQYRYVYRVMSRRLGGVSLGINLTPDKICNWNCVYCNVGPSRGQPKDVDIKLFEAELKDASSSDYVGLTIAGSGEPTLSRQLEPVIELLSYLNGHKTIITNGSRVGNKNVQRCLELWNYADGEIWLKVDTFDRMKEVNGVTVELNTVVRRVQRCGEICRTWIQTCVFENNVPNDSYLTFLSQIKDRIAGVQLYSPIREPANGRIKLADPNVLKNIERSIRKLGIAVRVAE